MPVKVAKREVPAVRIDHKKYFSGKIFKIHVKKSPLSRASAMFFYMS
jgi:hypothetical protein